jgi:hypothetical protein
MSDKWDYWWRLDILMAFWKEKGVRFPSSSARGEWAIGSVLHTHFHQIAQRGDWSFSNVLDLFGPDNEILMGYLREVEVGPLLFELPPHFDQEPNNQHRRFVADRNTDPDAALTSNNSDAADEDDSDSDAADLPALL